MSNSVVGNPAGPSWQIDIPSLANLIVRVGAEGLQKFAHAGVDIHTVGCMLALGEFTPACLAFRRKLQVSREKQRKESWWIHTLVEYGAGTNFVVDEFLKTRAGENMLSLLCSTISIFGERFSSEVLSLLFEEARAPTSSAPSLGQLQAIREVILPLARSLDFKDRVAEAHAWLLSIFLPLSPMDSFEGRENRSPLPDIPSFVFLVTKLKTLQMDSHSPRKRLIYGGIPGAAWLMVYASTVLGLPVCIIQKDGTPMPVNASYDAAVVLLFPGSDFASTLEVLMPPFEVITRTSEASYDRNWLLCCGGDGIDVFRLLCGWDIQDRSDIGSIIFSVALEYSYCIFSKILPSESQKPLVPDGFTPYYTADSGNVARSIARILHTFGLPLDLVQLNDWRQRYFVERRHHGRDTSNSLSTELIELVDHVHPGLHLHNGSTYKSCYHQKHCAYRIPSNPLDSARDVHSSSVLSV